MDQPDLLIKGKKHVGASPVDGVCIQQLIYSIRYNSQLPLVWVTLVCVPLCSAIWDRSNNAEAIRSSGLGRLCETSAGREDLDVRAHTPD